MSNFIKGAIEFVKLRFRIRDGFWFRYIRWYGVPYTDVVWSHEYKCPYIKSLDIYLKSYELLFVLEAYDLFQLLKTDLKSVIIQDNVRIILEYEDISVHVDSKQEVYIFKEVFHSTVYNIYLMSPCIVIDVGFNIGLASLFFAKKPQVKAIYAFEPMKPTLAKARDILRSNGHLANKIHLFEYGLAGVPSTEKVLYNYREKGNVGVKNYKVSKKDGYYEEIELKDGNQEISAIINNSPGLDICMKIDCEGSEYELISSLAANQTLAQITFLIVEFHFEGADSILQQLDKFSFHYFVFNEKSPIGMIYAWQSK